MIEKYSDIEIKFVTDTLSKSIPFMKKEDIDIVFFCLDEDNEDELMFIRDMKDEGLQTKFIILDFSSKKELFVKAIKYGVEGYILGSSDETEILYIIKEVYKGKKYYDANVVDTMVHKSFVNTESAIHLTPREKEILCEIGKGMNNREIAGKLYISEHTVKKHINHIFEKLKLDDRTQVALYANEYGISG